MLSMLSIRDFIIIDQLDLEFGGGLNVLTGETGAGKSILLDALGMALGNRLEGVPVRTGADQGSVTAVFEGDISSSLVTIMEEAGVPSEAPIILKRVITRDRRSRAFINDHPVSLSLLRTISDHLVEIHGQHDDRGLVHPAAHRALLDDFAGLQAELSAMSKAWAGLKSTRAALEKAEHDLTQIRAEADYIRQATAELSALAPEEGEEDVLADSRTRIMAANRIRDRLQKIFEELTDSHSGSLEDRLGSALRELETAKGEAEEPLLDPIVQSLERALMEVGEGVAALDQMLRDATMDENRVDAVEERLFALRAAGRKYNVPVAGLMDLAARLSNQLVALDQGEDQLKELGQALTQAEATYDKAAVCLHKGRQAASGKLDKSVMKELAPLKLERAQFTTEITELSSSEAAAHGRDRVEFTIATNPGAPAGPLGKIASGGELARFILALKVSLATTRSGPAMIFDEVDRGVGGATADAVGTRLAELSKGTQVLLVTHSPQVAAKADRHFHISKSLKKGQARTMVTELTPDQRGEEIARMLAGAEITKEARAAAESLMAAS